MQTKQQDSQLNIPTEKEIASTISELHKDVPHLTNSSGWIGGPDTGLDNEEAVSKVRVEQVEGTLSPYFADNYLAEVRSKLAALDLDRRYYLDVQDRFTRQSIEAYEWSELLNIHMLKVLAGWYTVDAEIAKAEAEGAGSWAKQMVSHKKEIAELLNPDVLKNLKNVYFASYEKAVLETFSMLSPYKIENARQAPSDDFTDKDVMKVKQYNITSTQRPFPKILKERPASDPNNWFGFLEKTFYSAIWLGDRSEPVIAASACSQRTMADAQEALANAQEKARKTKKDWMENDSMFRKLRTELSIKLSKLREDASKQHGGALNYLDELIAIRGEVLQRLCDVTAKSMVAADGFRRIWGVYSVTPPPEPWNWKDDQGSFILALKRWLLATEAEVLRHQPREFSTVIPLSVRSIASEAWTEAKHNIDENKGLRINFQIPKEAFAMLRSPRIRGISIYSHGASDRTAGVWSGWLRIPKETMIYDEKGELVPNSQPTAKCPTARVQTRNHPRPPDVIGTSLFRNFSPFSDPSTPSTPSDPFALSSWTIFIAQRSSLGEKAKELEDIQIDIIVSGYAV